MCGVAGVIRIDGGNIEPSLLTAMTDAIAHRGPDGEGQWIEGNVGIGHRRLSIIDLSETGHQPMVDASNRFVLSYNGEVYNFKELRRELEKLGHRFRGKSDSEVVLISFVEWGTSAFIKFNGMFALSIWDRKERVLTLARDRYGIKPLYHSEQSGVFSFGSEQKAIVANPAFSRTVNSAALLEYFTFQNIFTDQTLLEDMKILKAGHYMQVRESETRFQKTEKQYWDYRFSSPGGVVDSREYLEELRRLFGRAVDRQLVSDVEVGAYLSGGIDSGSIAAVASRSVPNLKTFTIGFDLSSAEGAELDFDERVKAEAMSAAYQTEHYEMVLKAGDMERAIPELAWHVEEPRVGQSYPNFYAAKLAGSFVKVVLSGTGGDELFGGYPWRYYEASNQENFGDYIDHYYLYWQRLASNSELRRLLEPIWGEVGSITTKNIFRDVFSSHENELRNREDFVNHSLYFESKTFLHGLLVVEDKLSMARGLETRVPFLDNDLVDFAMSCPVGLKLDLKRGSSRINENEDIAKLRSSRGKASGGKRILREALKTYLPRGVSLGGKQGFSSPDESWFRKESRRFVSESLNQVEGKFFAFLDRETVESLVQSHVNRQSNRRLLIWSFLSFNAWLQAYMKDVD